MVDAKTNDATTPAVSDYTVLLASESPSQEPSSSRSTARSSPLTRPASDARADVHHDLSLLNQAVQLLEPRFTTRALRSLPQLRLKLGTRPGGENLAHVLKNGNVYPESESRVWSPAKRALSALEIETLTQPRPVQTLIA